MAYLGVLPSSDSVTRSKIRDPNTRPSPFPAPPVSIPSIPVRPVPLKPTANSIPDKDFVELFETLVKGRGPHGSILFPGSKAYSQAIFIGNLLYFDKNPAAVVQAVTAEDVAATVSFAKKRDIQLSIKSGGHSMGGYCLNNGGIVLDISSMNNVDIARIDKLSGKKHVVASIGGGAVWNDVFQKAKDFDPNLVAIGGNCPSVGVSAFLLGGGVSPFSRSYGLGIDNLLEMTIVTADGEIVTVSKHETVHRRKIDLFWAVRGGGGGNFGVTVNVKVRLRELNDKEGKVVCGNLTWKLGEGQSEEEFKSMMELWNTPNRWPKEVRGDALWHYDRENKLVGKMTMVYNGGWAACMEDIWPLLKFNPQSELKLMHWTEWEAIDAKVDVFEQKYHHHASFIFGEGGITSEVTDIITNLLRQPLITENSNVDCYILWHHIGCTTTNVQTEDTAFYWRDGSYVFHVKMLWWGDANERLQDAIFHFFDDCKTQLRPYSLDQEAAYVNYIDSTVKNWGEVYYGKNFPRLCRIKREWDPTGFFSSPQGIPLQSDDVSEQQASCIAPADKKSWTKYALQTPQILGHPKTTDQVFATYARIRRTIVGIQ